MRVCCGPENRRECCFVDQLPQRTDLTRDTDLSSFPISGTTSNNNESHLILTPSSYTLVIIAIGLTLLLLLVLLAVFIYAIRRKVTNSSSSSSSSSSSCSSKSSSIDKPCHRLSVAVASSSKSTASASSPVPSTYADYWSRTIISPSEWTLTKPYTSFISPHPMNNYHYYTDH